MRERGKKIQKAWKLFVPLEDGGCRRESAAAAAAAAAACENLTAALLLKQNQMLVDLLEFCVSSRFAAEVCCPRRHSPPFSFLKSAKVSQFSKLHTRLQKNKM
jgi:hypothetical protein